ncbi:MAG: DNA ligase D [Bryobacteraceae bacterium]|jgi:bifunctional non-homologous end joining protein LigD
MAKLGEYARKRSFDKTPEPKPEVRLPAPAGQKFFCVQRHDATRLHYDFRLEVDGVLKSWAVPKGPSLEPLSKHLAMHVEDHPLDYGNFEGNIPKGEYGGGSVMLWDRGTWELLGDAPEQKQLERGDLKFRLHGEKLKGEFALVLMKGRGKGNEWLIIKKKDDAAVAGWNVEDHAVSVLTGRTQQEIADGLPPRKSTKGNVDPGELPGARKAPMPSAITPMLASLADRPPGGEKWLYEIKWDGVRAVCFIEDGRLRILSRNGNRTEQQYPELTVLPHFVAAETAILDGEIAVLDDQGRSSFSLIQPRIGVTDPNTIAHLARKTPATLFLFDLLYLNGFDLRAVPLTERKRALEGILKPSERFRYSQQFAAKGEEMLEAARQAGLEGVIAKLADSRYEERRSANWMKIKATNRQEFVVCGFTHGERAHFSSLVLGLYENGKLVHVGQVGTGFTDKSLAEIHGRLEPLVTKKSPFAKAPKVDRRITWVKPELVCEVKYLEFTPDGQLRAPVFLGLRFDKRPKESVRETPEPQARALIPEKPAEIAIAVDGHSLKFTNLNKIFYPAEGVTKRDVINYYDAVSEYILPHLRDRPLSLKRYPNGIAQKFFFQKHAENFAEWIRVEPIDSETRGDPIHYVIANDRATLLYLANLACIDQNPWMSRVGSLDKPDFALIDLDPVECPFDLIVEAAQLVHDKLRLIGLEGYPKTTGGDGMHVYIPLEPVYTYEQVRSFAEILAHLVTGDNPNLFTTPRAVAKRKKGRVYFDYLQIVEGKTIAAPYVLRAYAGAPVSTPLEWPEVKKGVQPTDFNIHNAVERFRERGDLFGPVLTKPQRLEEAIGRLSDLLGRGKARGA